MKPIIIVSQLSNKIIFSPQSLKNILDITSHLQEQDYQNLKDFLLYYFDKDEALEKIQEFTATLISSFYTEHKKNENDFEEEISKMDIIDDFINKISKNTILKKTELATLCEVQRVTIHNWCNKYDVEHNRNGVNVYSFLLMLQNNLLRESLIFKKNYSIKYLSENQHDL